MDCSKKGHGKKDKFRTELIVEVTGAKVDLIYNDTFVVL